MTDKTILDIWKSLYNFRIEEAHFSDRSCELTGEFDDVLFLEFYTPVAFQQLFSFLKHITVPRKVLYPYSYWYFSTQILNMTPQELKAKIALGVIPIDNSDWLR